MIIFQDLFNLRPITFVVEVINGVHVSRRILFVSFSLGQVRRRNPGVSPGKLLKGSLSLRPRRIEARSLRTCWVSCGKVRPVLAIWYLAVLEGGVDVDVSVPISKLLGR